MGFCPISMHLPPSTHQRENIWGRNRPTFRQVGNACFATWRPQDSKRSQVEDPSSRWIFFVAQGARGNIGSTWLCDDWLPHHSHECQDGLRPTEETTRFKIRKPGTSQKTGKDPKGKLLPQTVMFAGHLNLRRVETFPCKILP